MTLDMSDMTAHQLLMKLEEYKTQAQEAGENLVNAETLTRELKMKTEAVLAAVTKQFIDEKKSYNTAKMFALCSDEYAKAQAEESQAEHDRDMLKISYDLAKSSIRTLESIGYVRNNELKMMRG